MKDEKSKIGRGNREPSNNIIIDHADILKGATMQDNGTIIATTNYFKERLITGTPIGFVRDGNAVSIYFCDPEEAISPLKLHILSETIGNRLTDGQKQLVQELIELEHSMGFSGGRDESSDAEEWDRSKEIQKELGL